MSLVTSARWLIPRQCKVGSLMTSRYSAWEADHPWSYGGAQDDQTTLGVSSEVDLLSSHAVPGSPRRFRGALRERVGDATEHGAVRPGQGRRVLQGEPRRTGARRPARLRRARRERAPPERLRVHGLAEPDGRGTVPAHTEQLGDPGA